MTKKELLTLIRESVDEALTLKRHQDKIAVTSDLETRAEQSKETFKNKDKLKAAGFRWDTSVNSWTIDSSQLKKAMEVINAINKVEAFVEKIEDLPELIQGVDNLSKKDELSQKIDHFITALTTEVDEKAASEEVRKFIEFQAKLRSRSLHNTLLIYMQDRGATHVEGFRTWETKFGRRVKKGAKAITILAPRAPKKPGDSDEKDGSDIDAAVKKNNFMFFIAVNVFDIRSTEAIPGQEDKYRQEPEWHAKDTPNAKADKIFNYATQLADELGIKVGRDAGLGRGEMGYASGDHINITSNIDGVNKAGTMIHEIAHELLHFKKGSIFFIDQPLSKQDKEIQAESVSYVVLRHYDLPAQHQSTYLALFKANKDAIHKNLEAIKKTSDFIIKGIDKIATEAEAKEVAK